MSNHEDDGARRPIDAVDQPAAGSRRVHGDYYIALAILAFCALVFALTFTFATVPAAFAVGMGPAAFPRLLLGVMAVLALALFWSARGRADEVREPIPAMVYFTALAMVAFMGVLWIGGMVVAMIVGFVVLGALWGERRWPLLVGSGVGLTAFIYLLFTKGFGVPLPRGLIGDWLY